MPLRAASDHGTNADLSPNVEYCHYCYDEGSFTDPGITLEGKIKKNIAMAIKMGMSEKVAVTLANDTIPKLSRWRKK